MSLWRERKWNQSIWSEETVINFGPVHSPWASIFPLWLDRSVHSRLPVVRCVFLVWKLQNICWLGKFWMFIHFCHSYNCMVCICPTTSPLDDNPQNLWQYRQMWNCPWKENTDSNVPINAANGSVTIGRFRLTAPIKSGHIFLFIFSHLQKVIDSQNYVYVVVQESDDTWQFALDLSGRTLHSNSNLRFANYTHKRCCTDVQN